MYCPNCNARADVVDTITSVQSILRIRKCGNCGAKFYTEETIVPEEKVKPLFTEWSKERSRKHRAKKKGYEYDVKFTDGREEISTPKKPTNPLF